jgi:hydrogenase maturation protease
VRQALIGGIGNVLLGDDGVGPYVVRLLESRYDFDESVAIADLGTPALDLTHQIVGLRCLILVDSVTSDEPAGTLFTEKKTSCATRQDNGSIHIHRRCRNA